MIVKRKNVTSFVVREVTIVTGHDAVTMEIDEAGERTTTNIEGEVVMNTRKTEKEGGSRHPWAVVNGVHLLQRESGGMVGEDN